MAAMRIEYDTIVKNGTWSLCDLPFGRKAIISWMVALIATRLGLLLKVMLRKRALTLVKPLCLLIV